MERGFKKEYVARLQNERVDLICVRQKRLERMLLRSMLDDGTLKVMPAALCYKVYCYGCFVTLCDGGKSLRDMLHALAWTVEVVREMNNVCQ